MSHMPITRLNLEQIVFLALFALSQRGDLLKKWLFHSNEKVLNRKSKSC